MSTKQAQTAVSELRAKRVGIEKEIAATEAEITQRESALGDAIVDGQDPVQLTTESRNLADKLRGLRLGLQTVDRLTVAAEADLAEAKLKDDRQLFGKLRSQQLERLKTMAGLVANLHREAAAIDALQVEIDARVKPADVDWPMQFYPFIPGDAQSLGNQLRFVASWLKNGLGGDYVSTGLPDPAELANTPAAAPVAG